MSLPFLEWLRTHVKLQLDDGSVTDWEWWPSHPEMVAALDNPRLIVVKARQLGWSWLLAAYSVYCAEHLHETVLVLSAGQLESSEFLRKCKVVRDNEPNSIEPTISNTTQLGFPGGGVIHALPSTERAGRGFTAARIVVDEAAFHPYASQNYAAYAPAAERGQIIIVSSAGDDEKQVVNDWFQRMWEGSESNGFVSEFYAYDVRPGRDAAWVEENKKRLSARPGQFEREYPSTPQEAFRSMLSLRFDVAAIDYGKSLCVASKPSVKLPEGISPEHVSIWSEPRANIPYLIYSEPAEGKGKDYSVTRIREARTLRLCLEYRENVLEPEVHGAKARLLAAWYNMAYASWERNKGEGIAMAYAGYGRIYYYSEPPTRAQQLAGNKGAERPGIPITEATRDDLIAGLAVAIESGAIDNNSVGWDECSKFITVERTTATGIKHYRAQAAPGCHDDTVMCDVGLVHLSKQPGAQSLRASGAAIGRSSLR